MFKCIKKDSFYPKVGLFVSVFFLLFIIPSIVKAATYYIDATGGNDSANGLTDGTAWKTIDKVNNTIFSSGDNIYFKRGETWREQLTVSSSGSDGSPIIFSAYGTGANPVITGLDAQASWDGPNAQGEYTFTTATIRYVVVEDGVFIPEGVAGSLSAPGWDYSGGKVYYKPSSGTPSAHTVEIGSRNYAIYVTGQSYISITNLALQGSNSTKAVVYFEGTGSNINIMECNISKSYGNGIYLGPAIASSTVSWNTITEITADGVKLAASSTIVEHNDIHSIGQGNLIKTHDREGIGETGSNNIIQDNLIYDCYHPTAGDSSSGWGIVLYGSVNPIVRRNTIHDCDHAGITMDTTNGGEISYNIIYNNGKKRATGDGGKYGGIIINSNFSHSGVGIYNNTIYNNDGQSTFNAYNAGVLVLAKVNKTLGVTLKNNIIVGQVTGYLLSVIETTPDTLTFVSDNNGFYQETPSTDFYWNNSANNFVDYVTNSSQDSDSFNSDPQFTNVAISNFTLLAISPAIDNGTNLGEDYDDALNPESLWPSSVTTIDQDLRGSGWEIGAYAYPVPQTLTISNPNVLSSNSIRWNFTDNADNETGFKIYDGLGSIKTSSATVNLTYLDETGLSENTQYSGRYAVAYNSYGDSASSTVASAIYTIADTPTGLTLTADNTTGISILADTFPNHSSGSSGYYFANTTASTNSDWQAGDNTWSETTLSPNTQYTYTIKYRNGDGTETSTISSSKYTLIQAATGVIFDSVGVNSITIFGSGTISNLAEGTSGIYFDETSEANGGTDSDWIQVNSYEDTGLSENTQYTYKAKTRNGNSSETDYTDTYSKYTLTDTPTGLTGTVSADSISLTVDYFPNATSDSSGYYFYRSGGTPNSGWIQTNAWADTNIVCNNSYTYYVKYRNGDGVETSAISLIKYANSCGAIILARVTTVVSEPKAADNINTNNPLETNTIISFTQNEQKTNRENLIIKIMDEAVDFVKEKIEIILEKRGLARNLEKEQKTAEDYVKPLVANIKNVSNQMQNIMTNFILYGTDTTMKLGVGERAGVLNSYKKTYSALPEKENDWQDVIKIANGRFPARQSLEAEKESLKIFTKIYRRLPNFNNTNDEAAIKVMTYGIRSENRRIDSEKFVIKLFKNIFGNNPENTADWDIVRAIAYSGAKR